MPKPSYEEMVHNISNVITLLNTIDLAPEKIPVDTREKSNYQKIIDAKYILARLLNT